MAITAEQLIFQLTAKVAGFEDEINAAANIFDKASAKIEAGFGRMDKRIEQSSRANSSNIKAMVATITASLGVREVVQFADAWTKAKNALVSAKVPTSQQGQTLERLFKQSQAYSVELNSQAALYGQVSRAAKGLGGSTEDVFTFTEAVAAGLKADGKSAGEASGALLQLGQALRSPIVQAEEFNSLIDGAPSLLEAAANGIARFNGDLGALIKAAKNGDLASKELFEGVIAGSDELKARVGAAADTFESAYVRIDNALTRYIGQTDESLGASQRLIAGLNAFADDFDNLADTALKVAAVISGALVGRAIGGAITTIPIAIVTFRLLGLAASGAAGAASFLTANFGGATRAIAGATIASRAFKLAAFSMLAPTVLGLITAVATAFVVFGGDIFNLGESADEASARTNRLNDEMERLGITSKSAKTDVEDTTKALKELAADEIRKKLKDINDEIAVMQGRSTSGIFTGALNTLGDIKAELRTMTEGRSSVASSRPQKKLGDDLKQLIADAEAGKLTVEEIEDRLKSLAKVKVSDHMDELLAALRLILPKMENLKTLTKKVQKNTSGIKISGYPSGPDAEVMRSSNSRRFLDEQQALELRTAREKEIADLTEKYLKAATEAAKANKDAGLSITRAEAQAKATQTVDAKVRQTGLDSAVSGYVQRVVGVESGGDRFAKNPDSSATGLGQFIESTWLDLFRRYYPEEAANLGEKGILALRTDAAKSKALIEAYARENAAVLQQAGISVNDAADEYKLQLAHFLGPQGAINVLKAAPGTLAANVLGKKQVAANQKILGGGRTVDDVIAYGQQRAGQTTAGTQRLENREDFNKFLADERKELDMLKERAGLQASLNPLVNDYGLAMSRLEKAQYLLNQAQSEGSAAGKELSSVQQLLTGDLSKLTPEAREQALGMRQIAEGIGQADAASKKFEESQALLGEKLQESAALGKDVFGGFLRDLKAGKDGAELLGNALDKLGEKLINNGLDLLFDGSVAGSGGGILGGLFSIFNGGTAPKTFAKGGISRGPAIFGEAGAEAAVPLPDGRRIPVDLRMMKAPDLSGVTARSGVTADTRKIELSVNVTGARGNAEIMDMVSQGVSAGMSQTMNVVNVNLPKLIQNHQRRARL